MAILHELLPLSVFFHFGFSLKGSTSEENNDYFSKEAVVDYHKNAKCQLQSARKALTNFNLTDCEHILDIGCGEGRVTALIASQLVNGFIHGVDLSANMIDFAKQKYDSEHYHNLSFSVQDARHLDNFKDYDLITAFTSLHWISEQEVVLDSIYGSLSFGGRILFAIPCEMPFRVTYWKRQVINSDKWKPYFTNMPEKKFRYYTCEEYEMLLANAGFIHINIKKQQHSYLFRSFSDLCLWLTPLLPMQKRLPVEKRETFISDIANEVLKDFPPHLDGTITVKIEDLVIEASK